MKYFIGLFVFTLFTHLSAEEIRISGMTAVEGLDRSFVLQTTSSERVVLDCQSFIQGLNLGPDHLILLEPEECESLQDRIHSTLIQSQFHCLDAELELRSDYVCH